MSTKQNSNVVLGDREFFKDVPKIIYEGRESDNPLAFKFPKYSIQFIALFYVRI